VAWSFFFFLIKHQKLSEKGEKNKTLHLMRWNHTDKTSAQTDPCNFFLFFFFGWTFLKFAVSELMADMNVCSKQRLSYQSDDCTNFTCIHLGEHFLLQFSSSSAKSIATEAEVSQHAQSCWCCWSMRCRAFFFSQCSTDLGVAACISEKIKSMKQTKEQSLAPWLKQHFFSTFSIWQTFHESYF